MSIINTAFNVVSICLIVALIHANSSINTAVNYISYSDENDLTKESLNDFTEQIHFVNRYLYELASLESIPLKYPRVVLAQTILETGWFSSPIYRENNNATGMKHSGSEYCLPKGTCFDDEHACYASLWDCLLDYKRWQEVRLAQYEEYFGETVDSEEDYLDFLDLYALKGSNGFYTSSYAEDPLYTVKLRSLLTRSEVADSRLNSPSSSLGDD